MQACGGRSTQAYCFSVHFHASLHSLQVFATSKCLALVDPLLVRAVFFSTLPLTLLFLSRTYLCCVGLLANRTSHQEERMEHPTMKATYVCTSLNFRHCSAISDFVYASTSKKIMVISVATNPRSAIILQCFDRASVHPPPHGGGCTLFPSRPRALSRRFHHVPQIQCKNHVPLAYPCSLGFWNRFVRKKCMSLSPRALSSLSKMEIALLSTFWC